MTTPFTDPAAAAALLADAMRSLGQAAASGPFEVEVHVRVVTAEAAARTRRARLRSEQTRQESLQQYQERTEPSPFQWEPHGRGLSR